MKKIVLIMTLAMGYSVFGQSAFAKAEQLYQQKKYDQSSESFEDIYNSDRGNLKAIERLGDIEGKQENYEAAAKWYEKLIEKNPNNANYNFKYGAALGLQAKNSSKFKAVTLLDDVKEHLKKAAVLDPNHIEARHALSQMYAELPGIVGGSIRTSKLYADQLLKISKIDGYFAYGFIHEYEEEFKKAEKYYQMAVEEGGSETAYQKLAAVQENKLKNERSALKTMNEAYSKFPQNRQFKNDLRRLRAEVSKS